jgi:hypothetical protein
MACEKPRAKQSAVPPCEDYALCFEGANDNSDSMRYTRKSTNSSLALEFAGMGYVAPTH